MVEQRPVKAMVPGSSPGPGAVFLSIEDQGVPLVFDCSGPRCLIRDNLYSLVISCYATRKLWPVLLMNNWWGDI